MYVIGYNLVEADIGEHRRMITVMEAFGAKKKRKVDTLWTVRSNGRDSRMIYKELKRLTLDNEIAADRVHFWIAKYDPKDVRYAGFNSR